MMTILGTVTGNLNVVGDHDWFQVTLSANTLYAFSAVTPSGAPYEPNLVIFDAAGKIVDQLDADNVMRGVMGSLGFMPATSGTYYVDISSYSDTAYAYSLSLSAVTDDYRNNVTTTGTLAVGSTKTGNLNVVGDHDWFQVTLSAIRSMHSARLPRRVPHTSLISLFSTPPARSSTSWIPIM